MKRRREFEGQWLKAHDFPAPIAQIFAVVLAIILLLCVAVQVVTWLEQIRAFLS